MIWLNTYWTWQYFVMLVFVAVTAWMVGIRFSTWWFGSWGRFSNIYRHTFAVLWAAGATFFFHQVW